MAAGARGARGAPARGAVGEASSSHTATATAPGPSTAAATARAREPSTSPATPRSARPMVRMDGSAQTHAQLPWVSISGGSNSFCDGQGQQFLPAPQGFWAMFHLSFQGKAFGSSSVRSTTATTSLTWKGITWSGFPSMQECPLETDANSSAEPEGGANSKSLRPK